MEFLIFFLGRFKFTAMWVRLPWGIQLGEKMAMAYISRRRVEDILHNLNFPI